MNDRDALAHIIDPMAFGPFAEQKVKENPNCLWARKQTIAYNKVDQILTYVLNRVEEINPPDKNNDDSPLHNW